MNDILRDFDKKNEFKEEIFVLAENEDLKQRISKSETKLESKGDRELHKFSTEPLDDNCIRERVFIDGQEVKCCGYTLIHDLDEVPCVILELPVTPRIKDKAVLLHVENKEEIARLMDKTEFEEFCKIWKEIHNK